MPDPTDDVERLDPQRAQAFLGLVRAGENLVRDLDSELQAAHGIGLRAYEVLLHLVAYSDSSCLRMGQLSHQAPLSQSRVSRLVAELEQRGLVTRASAEGDARGVEVTVTDRGRALFDEAHPTHLAGLERHLFSRLTRAETAQLARITGKLLPGPVVGLRAGRDRRSSSPST